MGETDVTFRHLLRDLPRPILRLAFPRSRLVPLGPFDPSVDKPRTRTSDNLFRVRHGALEAAVHVEVEREWRTEIPRRLFEYASAAMVATRLPVWSVSAAILGSDTARRIFHVESIIQDPNVQELIREWEDKGRAKGRAEGRTEGRTEGHAEGRTEGRTEGRATEARLLLHKVLAARSFAVPQDVRARIDGESDVSRLESWIEAAVTAASLADVFRDR